MMAVDETVLDIIIKIGDQAVYTEKNFVSVMPKTERTAT
jgi:hypothetical protein